MASAAQQQAAIHAAALSYLQQRGYRGGAQLLTEDGSRQTEVKLNEMVSRDAQRKGPRCSLQLPTETSTPYDVSYAELCEWIKSRPADQQKELAVICFPMFVHCFIALVSKQPPDAAKFLAVSLPTCWLSCQHARACETAPAPGDIVATSQRWCRGAPAQPQLFNAMHLPSAQCRNMGARIRQRFSGSSATSLLR